MNFAEQRTTQPALAIALLAAQIRYSAGIWAVIGIVARCHPDTLEAALDMTGQIVRQAELLRWRGWNPAGVPISGR